MELIFNSVLIFPNLNASAAFETDTSKVFKVVLSQSFLEYGLWQDYGPVATLATLAEPRNANAADGSPASITPRS